MDTKSYADAEGSIPKTLCPPFPLEANADGTHTKNQPSVHPIMSLGDITIRQSLKLQP